jgi:hypothetical protein
MPRRKLPPLRESFDSPTPTTTPVSDVPSGPQPRDVEATPETPKESPGEALPPTEIVEEPTLGDLMRHAAPPRPSTVIAAEFSDEPLPPDFEKLGDIAGVIVRTAGPLMQAPLSTRPRAPVPSYSRPLPAMPSYIPDTAVYRVRVTPLEVFRYPGFIAAGAPSWIDRNWIAFSPADEARGYPAGPSLAVPGVGVARKDWFVVREQVQIAAGLFRERVNVYEPEVFFNWFLPVAAAVAPEPDEPDDAA